MLIQIGKYLINPSHVRAVYTDANTIVIKWANTSKTLRIEFTDKEASINAFTQVSNHFTPLAELTP